jgi:hypothetical protein
VANVTVFGTLAVYPVLRGGTVVTWQLHPRFRAATPYTFVLQWSHSGVTDASDWRDAATVSGQPSQAAVYTATDPLQRIWSMSDRLFYRVKLTDNNGQNFFSAPQTIFGELTRHNRLIAKEILRKELLVAKLTDGGCGTLFRRKDWGVPCDFPSCLDPDTGEVTNPDCPTCYGVGYKGGYYTPLDYAVTAYPSQPRRIVTKEPHGQDEDQIRWVRAIACPMPRTADLYLDRSNDRRYLVQTVKELVTISNYPIVLQVEMRLADPTDVVQLIPRDHTG